MVEYFVQKNKQSEAKQSDAQNSPSQPSTICEPKISFMFFHKMLSENPMFFH